MKRQIKLNKKRWYVIISVTIICFIATNCYVLADQSTIITKAIYDVEIQNSKYKVQSTFVLKEPVRMISLVIPENVKIDFLKNDNQISRTGDVVNIIFDKKNNEIQLLTEGELISEGKAEILLPVPKDGVLEQNKKIEFTLRLPKDETVDKVRPMGIILKRQGETYKSTLTTFIKSVSIEFSKGTKKDIDKIMVDLIVISVVISLFAYAFFEINIKRRRK